MNLMDLFSLPILIPCAALFGVTMKLADLFDEHGLKWFKGDAIIFGLLWGIFGSLLVLSRIDIANVVLAMILAFLVRKRLDYLNHTIAATMIIVVFLWQSSFDLNLFLLFFVIFALFGGLRDYLGDVRKKKDWIFYINEPASYYVIPTAIYGVFTGNWIIFIVFTVYLIFYDLVKYGLFYLKKYSKL